MTNENLLEEIIFDLVNLEPFWLGVNDDDEDTAFKVKELRAKYRRYLSNVEWKNTSNINYSYRSILYRDDDTDFLFMSDCDCQNVAFINNDWLCLDCGEKAEPIIEEGA